MTSLPLKPTEFANMVNAITDAFGDPTRRSIYLLVREQNDGLTSKQVAKTTGLHINVVRYHLEKLAAGGYLRIARNSNSSVGRPAKVYTASVSDLHLRFEVGQDDILVALLTKALTRLPESEAEAMAEEVGERYGAQLAANLYNAEGAQQRSISTALQVVADILSARGFRARIERHRPHDQPGDDTDGSSAAKVHMVSDHCPFGDVAIDNPVICALDRGMVRAMLSTVYGETSVVINSALAHGDKECVTEICALRG